MKKINIQGREYPFRLTIGAMVAYKRETGEDFSQFKGDDMEKLGIIIFHGVKSACKIDNVPFTFGCADDIIDYIDMSDAAKLLDGDSAKDTGSEKKS